MAGDESQFRSGQQSPDGMWRWNGHTWELTAAAAAPPKPGFTGARLTSIVVLALVCLAALVVGGVALARNLQIGAGSCLPSDFPSYPGATVGSEVAYTGTPHQCVMELHTGVPQETVVQFYESRLSGGDWRLDTFSDQTGTMTFHRISQPQTGGKVIFVANAQGTSVNILVRGR